VNDRIATEDEIKKPEQYEALKQMLLLLLDDPQVQQKIVTLLRRRLGADPTRLGPRQARRPDYIEGWRNTLMPETIDMAPQKADLRRYPGLMLYVVLARAADHGVRPGTAQ
jgi:hypothetical protein